MNKQISTWAPLTQKTLHAAVVGVRPLLFLNSALTSWGVGLTQNPAI